MIYRVMYRVFIPVGPSKTQRSRAGSQLPLELNLRLRPAEFPLVRSLMLLTPAARARHRDPDPALTLPLSSAASNMSRIGESVDYAVCSWRYTDAGPPNILQLGFVAPWSVPNYGTVTAPISGG
jgi:hypothetical protein